MAPTKQWHQLSTLINVESSRAFSNLFEVAITPMEKIIPSTLSSTSLTYQAKSLNFSDNFGFKLELNEAIQTFMMQGIERIKGVSIVFKETSEYTVTNLIKSWMNSIYDFNQHVFLPGDPTGNIKVNLDDNHHHTGSIVIEDVIPQTLTYPNYTWSDSNPIEITATFVCGRVYWDKSLDDTFGSTPNKNSYYVSSLG
jgi:hypothetical protein